MKVNVINPTKAIITEHTPAELDKLRKACSYTNSSISMLIKKHWEKQWLKEKDPVGWQVQLNDLQAQERCSLLEESGHDLYIRPGFLSYIKSIDLDVAISIKYPEITPLPWKKPIPFNLYDYQKKSVASFFRLSEKHGHISLPTGAGKGAILLTVIRTAGLDAVVVVPSKSIFNELLEKFQEHLGKDLVGGFGNGKKDLNKKITIAIGKSLTMIEPGSEAYHFFNKKQLMAVDESHVFASAQLEKVCHGVLSSVPYRLFVSATQVRNDGGQKLLNSIIGPNLINMSIKEGIEGGFLSPLNFLILKTFSKSTKRKKDAIENKREHFLYNQNIAELYGKFANSMWRAKKESTLILVEELRQIEMLKDLIDVPFTYIHSAAKKEAAKFGLEKVSLKEELERFNNGEVKVLIGTRCIATGTNIYPVHNCINWMGGNSEIITKQGAMGRSTRLLEKSEYKDLHSPKPFARIVDCRVEGNQMLERHLKKRIEWYAEADGEIKEL